MLPSLIGSIECISVPCGGGQMPPSACECVCECVCMCVCVCACVCLASHTQSDGDQRIATVRTVSHEVILSAPLRLRSLYANVWRSSGLLCKGSTLLYPNSWKADISVEQTFKVNTKGPCPGPSYRMSKSPRCTFNFIQRHLSTPDTSQTSTH